MNVNSLEIQTSSEVEKLLKKCIPHKARKFVSSYRKLFSCLHARRSVLRRLESVPTRGVHINYGLAIFQSPDSIIHGGRVKLMALQSKYPECDRSFNILYLVSSAMPKCAHQLIDVAKQRGVRVVWNQNGVAYRAWAGDDYAIVNSRIGWAMHKADYVIYQSDFCRESADRFLGQAEAPWSVLYNPVDTTEFLPPGLALPAEPWVILIAGTHQQPSRVLSVLKALRILLNMGRDAKVVLAGRLDWEGAIKDLETWSGQMHISSRLEIKGPYRQSEAVGLYQQAHVLVHSKYKDPCPTVVIEALSCGLPVIGSKSGGMKELVGHEAGVLLEVPDSWEEMHVPSADRIARAIINVMEHREKYAAFARQRAVANFDVGPWLTEHGRIFADVIA